MAMADLKDPEQTHEDNLISNEKLATFIQQIVQSKINSITNKLTSHDKEILHAKDMYNIFVRDFENITDQINKITTTQERLNRQINFVSRQIENFDNRFNTIDLSIPKSPNNDPTKIDNIIHTQEKVHRRLARLKEGTKGMFHQTKSDYDMLTDCIHRLETDVKNIQQANSNSTKKKLDYKIPFDSDDSSSTNMPSPKREPKQTPPSTNYEHTKYYRDPNIDYLRKNANITCSTQEQILEFYIKLRLAISKGGIHIIPIEAITKNNSIAHQMTNMTSSDLLTLSNALFTLLSNENLIPKTFTMAQNCILGYASTMDGFGASQAMLKLTHPLLSRKRPPNVPLVLSNSTDIYSYEQSLQNYYLFHKL